MSNFKVGFNLNTILLAMIGFFATWGEGMQLLIQRASLIYPALVVVYIFLNFNNFIKSLRGGVIVPKEFKLLFLFVLFHTLIYLLLNFNSIGFGVESGTANDEGYAYGKSSGGLTIIRYFLFLLFCLYSTIAFSDKSKLFIFSLFYTLGFTATILGGAFHSYSNALIRFSGGLQDPNAMAFDAIVSLMFSLHLVNTVNKKSLKIVALFTIVIEVIAILLSFSRGALLAVLIWSIYYVFHLGIFKKINKIIVFGLIAFLVGSIVIKNLGIDTELINERFSIQEMKESKGSNRGDIWNAYLSSWDKYIVTGTGMTNYSAAIKNNRLGVAEEYETHNLYLLFFVEFGLIGLLLYLNYWRGYLRILRRTKGTDFFLISMGLLMMIDTFFLNLNNGRTWWIVFAIVNMIWIRSQTSVTKRIKC